MSRISKAWKKYSFVVLFVFLAGGLADFRIALAALICMVGPVAVALFRGRFWCGNVCPRGSLFDTLMRKYGRKKYPPVFLKSYAFRIPVIAVMFAVLGFGVWRSDGSLFAVGQVIYRLIFMTTLVGIALALSFNHRTWCGICPMGTISSLVSRTRKSRNVLRVSDSCVSCKVCSKHCPLALVPHAYKGDLMSHPDCIQCGRCAASCPKDAIGYGAKRIS